MLSTAREEDNNMSAELGSCLPVIATVVTGPCLLRSLRSPSSAAPLSVHLRSRSVPRFTRHSRLRRVLREKKSVNEGPRSER